VRKR
jgi:hypothetical protein